MSKPQGSVVLSKISDDTRVTIETQDQETFVVFRDEASGDFSVSFMGEDCAQKYLGLTDGLQQPYEIACDFSGLAANWYGQSITVGDRLLLIPALGRRSRTARISCIMVDGAVIAGEPLETTALRHSNWTLLAIFGLVVMFLGLFAITAVDAPRAGLVAMIASAVAVVAGIVGRIKYSWARPYNSLVP
jgi:hypothetical protein